MPYTIQRYNVAYTRHVLAICPFKIDLHSKYDCITPAAESGVLRICLLHTCTDLDVLFCQPKGPTLNTRTKLLCVCPGRGGTLFSWFANTVSRLRCGKKRSRGRLASSEGVFSRHEHGWALVSSVFFFFFFSDTNTVGSRSRLICNAHERRRPRGMKWNPAAHLETRYYGARCLGTLRHVGS